MTRAILQIIIIYYYYHYNLWCTIMFNHYKDMLSIFYLPEFYSNMKSVCFLPLY